MQRVHATRVAAVLGSALATLVASTTLAPVSVAAPGATAAAERQRGPTVLASGLNNPRLLSFRGRTLYVAEAGKGGAGPCRPSPEGGSECYGASGSITQVRGRHARRILTGLPSLAGPDGSQALGAAGVVPLGRRLAISFGGGGTPAQRALLPGVGRWLGTLAVASHRGKSWRRHTVRVLADLMAYEARRNPDRGEIDSDPTGFVRTRGHFVVADAAGNDVLRVGGHRSTSTLAVFADRMVDNPFAPGKVPMQAVPTSVAVGPRGVLYVSELTGFPFPQGASRIYRLVPGHAPTVWATGLTNVTDIAWHRGSLYAVQIADHGLLAPGMPMGSLVKVRGGAVHRTVAGSLSAPYGVALRRGAAYVTTCSVCAGGGKVLRIPLH